MKKVMKLAVVLVVIWAIALGVCFFLIAWGWDPVEAAVVPLSTLLLSQLAVVAYIDAQGAPAQKDRDG